VESLIVLCATELDEDMEAAKNTGIYGTATRPSFYQQMVEHDGSGKYLVVELAASYHSTSQVADDLYACFVCLLRASPCLNRRHRARSAVRPPQIPVNRIMKTATM
jgi:hypothetical protein